MRIARIAIITATLALSFGTISSVLGQRVGDSGTVKEKPNPTTGAATPSRRTNAPIKQATRTVIREVTRTTGSLSVAAEPAAAILVEPINVRNGRGQEGVVPSGARIFIFNDLKPGRYRVAGTLDGYHQVETEIEVAANNSKSVTLMFRPVLYTLTINTNVQAGELKYAAEGRPLSNVVPIQNKGVTLNLSPGRYALEMTSEDFGYETLSKTVSLESDKTTLDLPLKRIALTTDTLSPIWTSAELQGWEMPKGWAPDERRNLLVKGPGLALPRVDSFRFYKDFRLSSSVKMINGVAISFALRARDSQNYYLLQLTGEKADEPSTLRLFVVKNRVEQRLRAIPIPRSSAATIGSGQFFAVSIKMIDYAITVEIEDSQTGAAHTWGPDGSRP